MSFPIQSWRKPGRTCSSTWAIPSALWRVLNDPLVGPDPYPSPDLHPVAAAVTVRHAFAAGTYAVVLTVTDDDGGRRAVPIEITV